MKRRSQRIRATIATGFARLAGRQDGQAVSSLAGSLEPAAPTPPPAVDQQDSPLALTPQNNPSTTEPQPWASRNTERPGEANGSYHGSLSSRNGLGHDEGPAQKNLPIAKRYHKHHRTQNRYAYDGNDEDVIEEGICTSWSQPVFRGSIYALDCKDGGVESVTEQSNGDTEDDRAFQDLRTRPARLRTDARYNQSFLRGLNEHSNANSRNSGAEKNFPTFLININTGKLVHGEKGVPYVIGSYVCQPELLPLYPRYKRREPGDARLANTNTDFSGEEWEYSTSHFDEVMEKVKLAEKASAECIPKFWILDDSSDMSAVSHKYLPPMVPEDYSPEQANYILEVYYYLVAEAEVVGVQHVWLDCLCVDQKSPTALAAEIPQMHSYYRGAKRCVVVSEMLRRGLSHDLDHLGLDLLDPTLEAELPTECFGETHRRQHGLEYEVFGWLIGFHQLRVWLFQETYLSRELVHRGRNIRLNTRDLLTYGIRAFHIKESHEARKACQKLLQRRMPISSAMNGEVFHPNLCLGLIRGQGRRAGREEDYVFGILGLFELAVRSLVPTDYSVSLPALSAMLVYARIRSGDLMAFFIEESDDTVAKKRHAIKDAPAWMPRTIVQMAYEDSGLNYRNQGDGRAGPEFLTSQVTQRGVLVLKAPHYRIHTARLANRNDVLESLPQQSQSDTMATAGGDDGKVDWRARQDVGTPSSKDQLRVEIEPGDLVLELVVRPQLTVHLYVKRRQTPGEQKAIDILVHDTKKRQAALVCIETTKTAHFWLVLAAHDTKGKTWEILGRLETSEIHGGISASGMEAPPKGDFRIP